MKQSELEQALETLMDTNSIYTLLCALELVCEAKSAYVLEGGSHGDPSPYMARQWHKVAGRLALAQNYAAGL